MLAQGPQAVLFGTACRQGDRVALQQGGEAGAKQQRECAANILCLQASIHRTGDIVRQALATDIQPRHMRGDRVLRLGLTLDGACGAAGAKKKRQGFSNWSRTLRSRPACYRRG